MSLEMMGHDPTKMPGATLASAVGNATSTMRDNRMSARERALEAAKAQYGLATDAQAADRQGLNAISQMQFAVNEAQGGMKAPDREYKKGADGFYRYIDTGEPVFPDVVQQQQDAAAAKAKEEADAAAAEQAKASEQGLSFLRNEIQRAIGVNLSLEQAGENVSFWNSGLPGQVLRGVGGTSAADQKALIDHVKSNIGFDRLQEMRKDPNNTTGGALGQVAIKELEFLQAAMGSLEQAQSPEQLQRSLRAVKEHYEAFLRESKKDFAKAGGSVDDLNAFEQRLREIRIGPPKEAVRVGKYRVTVE
jgi:hypothetical protein